MVVTLIGYRGCGKSSVAPLLAELLGCEFVDSDETIQDRAGCDIAQIFASDGEAGFRQLETDVLKDLLCRKNLVIASGGGAVLSEVNRSRMQAAGPVVWLQVPADVLAVRIGQDSASATQRPSLTGKTIEEEVSDVLKVRTPIYTDAATICVDANDGSPASIANQIYASITASDNGGLK